MYGDKIVVKDADYLDPDSEDVLSDREYLVYEMMAVRIDDPSGYRPDHRPATLRLYVDTTNGVVTYDVEQYEKSLK